MEKSFKKSIEQSLPYHHSCVINWEDIEALRKEPGFTIGRKMSLCFLLSLFFFLRTSSFDVWF